MTKMPPHATAALIATRTVAMLIQATPIRQDAQGRYCLNDLHVAAGAQKRHSPNYFIHLDASKEMIADIESTGFPVVKAVESFMGRAGGTYVHEDLALDYAGWISASFRREVYRAFKESRKTQPTDMGTVVAPAGAPLSTLLLMASEAVAEKERLELQIETEKPLVEYAEATMATDKTMCMRDAGKNFGTSDQRLIKFLIDKGVLYRKGKSLFPYQQWIDSGHGKDRRRTLLPDSPHARSLPRYRRRRASHCIPLHCRPLDYRCRPYRPGRPPGPSDHQGDLTRDVSWAARAVDQHVHVPLSDNQRFALISFVFNMGEPAFVTSTLLRLLNAGDYAAVPTQLLRWNKEHVNGVLRENAGLTNRRKAEITLWATL